MAVWGSRLWDVSGDKVLGKKTPEQSSTFLAVSYTIHDHQIDAKRPVTSTSVTVLCSIPSASGVVGIELIESDASGNENVHTDKRSLNKWSPVHQHWGTHEGNRLPGCGLAGICRQRDVGLWATPRRGQAEVQNPGHCSADKQLLRHGQDLPFLKKAGKPRRGSHFSCWTIHANSLTLAFLKSSSGASSALSRTLPLSSPTTYSLSQSPRPGSSETEAIRVSLKVRSLIRQPRSLSDVFQFIADSRVAMQLGQDSEKILLAWNDAVFTYYLPPVLHCGETQSAGRAIRLGRHPPSNLDLNSLTLWVLRFG